MRPPNPITFQILRRSAHDLRDWALEVIDEAIASPPLDQQAVIRRLADELAPRWFAFIEEQIHAAVDDLVARQGRARLLLNHYNQWQPRDSLGRWVDANGGGLSVRHNIARGVRALRRVVRHGKDVQKAMYRQGLGQIDFLWGTPGAKNEEWQRGHGISHVLRKHPNDLRLLPVAIAKGRIRLVTGSPDKRSIEYQDVRVVLVKANSRRAWMLTGYSRRQVDG
jgi:hypothetical protein